MISLFISILLFCFIVWGIPLLFLKEHHILPRVEQGECHTHFIMTTKNTEDSIEGIIRSIAWQMSNKPINSFLPTDLFIFDLNSTDHTYTIIQKLAKEYTFIHPMTKSEYTDFINDIK